MFGQNLESACRAHAFRTYHHDLTVALDEIEQFPGKSPEWVNAMKKHAVLLSLTADDLNDPTRAYAR